MSKEKKRPSSDVRRGQVITTWGVGAIVPLANGQSGLVGGLDEWDNDNPVYRINDPRLAKKLGVSSLKTPPAYMTTSPRPELNGKTIPLYVFPLLHYCPKCKTVRLADPYSLMQLWCMCDGEDGTPMVPERFVVVCPNGHISDLPILEKFAKITNGSFDPIAWKTDKNYWKANPIYRIVNDRTASIRGITYRLGERNSEVRFSIADLLGSHGLEGLYKDDKCPGNEPWLIDGAHEECECGCGKMQVVQKGGTNVWISHIESSIYIPPSVGASGADELDRIIAEFKPKLDKAYSRSDGDNEQFVTHIEFIIDDKYGVKPEDVAKRYVENLDGVGESNQTITDAEYRYEEYSALTKNCGGDKEDLFVEVYNVSEYDTIIRNYFESISLVRILKETQALVGFSRLERKPEELDVLKSRLRKNGKIDWLPAVQTSGEGIFFKFSESAIQKWLGSEVTERAKKINSSASYVMIHTFAHAIINEISKVCGYGSSSIKERIYVSEDEKTRMFGVLIYTSSGSNDASLGGLVRQGKPGVLEDLIVRAIQNASWCTDDPICIESEGQGPDSCNLAACHNCVLLPETCCETGNRFLDRAMLVGEINRGKKYGFFNSLLQEDA